MSKPQYVLYSWPSGRKEEWSCHGYFGSVEEARAHAMQHCRHKDWQISPRVFDEWLRRELAA